MRRELTPRTLGHLSLAVDRLDHASGFNRGDGWEWRAIPTLRQQLNAWLAATLSTSFTWHDMRPEDEAYISGGIGLGLNALLPHDFSFQAGLKLKRARYMAPDNVFGRRRKDWKITTTARLTYGKLTAFDLAPYLQYQYERRDSTISLHQYDNHAVIVGLTKRF